MEAELISRWSISDLYRKSWNLVKQHKKLWILGLAVALFSSGNSFRNSYEGNTSSNSETLEQSQTLESNDVESSSEESSYTAVISRAHQLFSKEGISLISPNAFLFIVLQGMVAVGLVIIVAIVSQNWAQAALIIGIDQAHTNKKVSIEKASMQAYSQVWSFFWTRLRPWLHLQAKALIGILALAVFAGLIQLFGYLLNLSQIQLLFIPLVLALIAGIGYYVYLTIKISLQVIWAERLLLLKKLNTSQALDSGMNMANGRNWDMIILGFINSIVSGVIVLVLVSPIIGTGFYLGFKVDNFDFVSIMKNFWILFVGLILLFGPLFQAVRAVLSSFITTTWHFAYKVALRDEYENR